MDQAKKLSRRDVLRLAAATATSALIAACAPQATEVIKESVPKDTGETAATVTTEAPTQQPAPTDPPAATEAPTVSPSATVPGDVAIAKVADVPPGSSLDFTYGGKPAILVNLDGEYRSYVNVCTHNGCQTRYYGGPALNCPCHGSAFDVATGEAIQGPASSPLRKIDVFVEEDTIYHSA